MSSGRTASKTGDVTRERLSLMVFWPAAPARRAAEIELPGIHNAGWPPNSAGHLPMKPLRTASDAGRLDADLHAVVADRTGRLVVPVGELLHLIGDGRIDDNRNRLFAAHTASGGLVGAVGQRVAKELPEDHGADHYDDGNQGDDHADADSAPPSLIAVTALPVAESAVAPPEKRWPGRRRARGLGLSGREFRVLIDGGARKGGVGGGVLLCADAILIAGEILVRGTPVIVRWFVGILRAGQSVPTHNAARRLSFDPSAGRSWTRRRV